MKHGPVYYSAVFKKRAQWPDPIIVARTAWQRACICHDKEELGDARSSISLFSHDLCQINIVGRRAEAIQSYKKHYYFL